MMHIACGVLAGVAHVAAADIAEARSSHLHPRGPQANPGRRRPSGPLAGSGGVLFLAYTEAELATRRRVLDACLDVTSGSPGAQPPG